MPPPVETLPVALLRASLRADAPVRELSVTRFMLGTASLSVVLSIALGPAIGWSLSIALAGALGSLAIYFTAIFLALRTGWYHPAVAWANAFVEVSGPVLLFVLDAKMKGPEYALSSPPLIIWGGLVVFSALRTSRALSLAAGAVAATEYMIFYFAMVYPRLPPNPPVAFTPAFIAIRALLLLCCGWGGSIIANQFVRKAVEAFKTVRSHDLMGKYFLHEKLGQGGMAEVFRATYSPEGGFEKAVAVKRVLPQYSEDLEFVELFREEAGLCSLLSHPNVVQVWDVGRFEDTYVLAMELVEGLSLSAVLRGLPGPLPLAAITYVGAEIASALDYVHRRTDAQGLALNLVHRDVNPPNILVSSLGEVKLADFGVARAANRVSRTQAGYVRGKIQYTAPEQIKMLRFDGRADLFCLGVTLHELITGERLFTGDVTTVIRSVMAPKPRPGIKRAISPELDALVMSLLEIDPAQRPQTGRELRTSLLGLKGAEAPYPAGQGDPPSRGGVGDGVVGLPDGRRETGAEPPTSRRADGGHRPRRRLPGGQVSLSSYKSGVESPAWFGLARCSPCSHSSSLRRCGPRHPTWTAPSAPRSRSKRSPSDQARSPPRCAFRAAAAPGRWSPSPIPRWRRQAPPRGFVSIWRPTESWRSYRTRGSPTRTMPPWPRPSWAPWPTSSPRTGARAPNSRGESIPFIGACWVSALPGLAPSSQHSKTPRSRWRWSWTPRTTTAWPTTRQRRRLRSPSSRSAPTPTYAIARGTGNPSSPR